MMGSEFGAKAPGAVVGCGYGWRVKLYQLESEGAGAWQDQGTGNVICKSVLSGPAIVVMNESEDEEYAPLLQSKIQIEDVYERQGESIIMWRESDYAGDVDYALSFQDTAGCHAIWEAIGDVQSQYNQQREYGVIPSFSTVSPGEDLSGGTGTGTGTPQSPLLPTVTAGNLQEIRDKLFSAHSHPSPSLRESYVLLVLERGADFFHRLITVYSDLEDLEDIEGLVKIAEICRAVLFLNDAGILEYVLTDNVFVHVAGALEYDPALKSRGEYREFLTRCVHVQNTTVQYRIGQNNTYQMIFDDKYFMTEQH
jgi:protein phosphatase 4 regulatory subunit 3